jgi:hypothetical protein
VRPPRQAVLLSSQGPQRSTLLGGGGM